MLITKRILASALMVCAGSLLLTGCGQTGALYLPSRTLTTTQPKPPAPPMDTALPSNKQ